MSRADVGEAVASGDPRPVDGRPGRRVSWLEIGAIAAIVGIFLAIGVAVIGRHAPFSHDESVYALRARLYAGVPTEGTYWADYRAPGLPVLLRLAYEVRPSDGALRMVPLLLAAGLIVLAWAWGRHLVGPATGLLTAGLLTLTPGFHRFAWQLLLDTPGAFFAMAAVLTFTLATGKDRIGTWALLAIPLAAFATAVRFGAPVLVVAGMGAVALVRWRSLLSRPWLSLATLAGTAAGMLAVLTVPGLTGATKPPLVAFRDFRVRKGNPFGRSYAEFADVGPALLGRFVGWIVAAGLVLAIVVAVRHKAERGSLAIAFVMLTAFVLGLGLALGQGRGSYLTPALVPLHVLAATGLAWAASRLPRGIVALAILGSATVALSLTYSAGVTESNRMRLAFDPLTRAARAAGEAASGHCVVFTSYTPQAGWYSGCSAISYLPQMYQADSDDTDEESIVEEWFRRSVDPVSRCSDDAYLIEVKGGKRSLLGPIRSTLGARLSRVVAEFGEPDARRLRHVIVTEMALCDRTKSP